MTPLPRRETEARRVERTRPGSQEPTTQGRRSAPGGSSQRVQPGGLPGQAAHIRLRAAGIAARLPGAPRAGHPPPQRGMRGIREALPLHARPRGASAPGRGLAQLPGRWGERGAGREAAARPHLPQAGETRVGRRRKGRRPGRSLARRERRRKVKLWEVAGARGAVAGSAPSGGRGPGPRPQWARPSWP